MENKISAKFHFLMLAAVFFLLIMDQLTKWLAIRYLMPLKGEGIDIIPACLQLRYLENKGAAFGILQNAQWFFLILTALLLLFLLYVYVKLPFQRKYLLLRWIMVVLAAGAVGNAIDRARFRYVVDFIYFSLINFPIFNVADIYVTCSIFVLVISLLFIYKEEDLEILKKK